MTGKATVSIPEAARLLGIGRTTAYELASRGEFPVPVLRVGRQFRVPLAGMARVLGLTIEEVAALAH